MEASSLRGGEASESISEGSHIGSRCELRQVSLQSEGGKSEQMKIWAISMMTVVRLLQLSVRCSPAQQSTVGTRSASKGLARKMWQSANHRPSIGRQSPARSHAQIRLAGVRHVIVAHKPRQRPLLSWRAGMPGGPIINLSRARRRCSTLRCNNMFNVACMHRARVQKVPTTGMCRYSY